MRVCGYRNCGKDISDKRKNALFCSRTCKEYNRRQANGWDRPTEVNARKSSRRRAVTKGVEVGYVPSKPLLYAFYGAMCMIPGCSNVALHLDHIIPLAKGGPHGLWNVQLLCGTCNSQKGDRDDADHRPYPKWQDRVGGEDSSQLGFVPTQCPNPSILYDMGFLKEFAK